MCVRNRLPLLKDWMTNNREALFDMMITDEAHHYPAPTWIGLAEDLEEASPPDLCIRQIRKGISAARDDAGKKWQEASTQSVQTDDTKGDVPSLG